MLVVDDRSAAVAFLGGCCVNFLYVQASACASCMPCVLMLLVWLVVATKVSVDDAFESLQKENIAFPYLTASSFEGIELHINFSLCTQYKT